MATAPARTLPRPAACNKPECIGSVGAYCYENKGFTRHFAHCTTKSDEPGSLTAKAAFFRYF